MGQVKLSGKAGLAPGDFRIRKLDRASKTLEVFRLPFVLMIEIRHSRSQRYSRSVLWLCVVEYLDRG